MLRTRTLAFISVTTGIFSILCLLLIMTALQDIYYGAEPSLAGEWKIVKLGLPAFLILHILSLVGTIIMLHKRGKGT